MRMPIEYAAYTIPIITLRCSYYCLDILPHHPDVEIIVPRNKPAMAHRAKQRSEHKPITNTNLFAEPIELEQKPAIPSLQ